MSGRPIGEMIAPILARAHAMHGFQVMLNRCAPADRKSLIMAAKEAGAIDADDTRLLIEAYQLETA